jgi:protein-histidine N-methyltransferase
MEDECPGRDVGLSLDFRAIPLLVLGISQIPHVFLSDHQERTSKMSAFSFSFSGEDIEEPSTVETEYEVHVPVNHAAETGTLQRHENSAFPIAGQRLLPPQRHDLEQLLHTLPSKIVYSTLAISLDDGGEISIPRRELWDVRVQLMAEEDDEGLGNLGKDDVRTGIYEGGFKSWESSVDVAKVLHQRENEFLGESRKFLEVCLHHGF